MSRRLAAVLFGAALLLTGCAETSAGGDAAPGGQLTVTETVSPHPPPAVPSPDAAAPAPPAPAPAPMEQCGVDTQAAAIHDNLHRVPPPATAGEGWEYHGHSNYDPCADLSYATVHVTGSTHALKQNQLLLFHRGDSLGVGALVPQVHEVMDADGRSVTVRYIDSEAMERAGAPNAEAEHHKVTVTFWWNGERVEPVGRIPNQNR